MMRFFTFLILGFLPLSIIAQLQTTTGQTPTQLVQDVLLGSGVQVSNVNYSGANNAIGTFDATNTSLGIQEGIIMTTGTVKFGPDGPYGPNNKADAGMDNGAAGYGQLSTLVGTSTFNATLLEFDFIPFSDTVRFKYIFASEEYPEYVGTQFNDVFAFFISGPGIVGPGNTKNMAIIPGTNQEVAINNVNHLSNTAYYQNNGDGSTAPYNNNPYYIQYDGFTKPLEAISKVQCGEKYHLIIAIADVGDAIYDSGIFLEKNSLNSDQPVKVEYELTSNPYGDGQTMAQNCSGAVVTLTRTGNSLNQSLTIPVNVSGSAIEGLDYSTIPTSIYFPPGQATVTFTIDAFNNLGLTSIANIILQFEIEDPCGNEQYQTIELFIKPVEPLSIVFEDVALLCPGEPLELIPEVTGGGGDYTYSWSTGETTPTIVVNPSSTESYTVSVTDDCLDETITATVEVSIPDNAPLVVVPSSNIVEQCPYVPNIVWVTASGGAGVYDYEWFDSNGTAISISDTADVRARETTVYTVTVTDFCGEKATTSVTVTVLSPPLILEITPQQQICPGDSIELVARATGGWGNYYYSWPYTGDTTASIWVKPNETTDYLVIVKDDCQTFQVQTKTTVKVVRPTADFTSISSPPYINLPVNFQNLSKGGETYFWDLGNGETSTLTHPNTVYGNPGAYFVTLVTTDKYGCIDSITKPIRILDEVYLYIPNSFTPDGDRSNNTFEVSAIGIQEFEIKIYNRWGEIMFESYNLEIGWDGTYNGRIVPDGTYIWKMKYKSIRDEDSQIKVGHVNVLK